MRILALILLCLSCSKPVQASNLVGQADFSFLWLELYRATLYHPSGQFSFNDLAGTRLVLNYRVAIKAKDLVNKTRQHWGRLGYEVGPEQRRWLDYLSMIWPNISEGDSLAFEVKSPHVGVFEYQQPGKDFKEIGRIESAKFSHDFLAIWLAEQDQHKAFRLALLGRKEK